MKKLTAIALAFTALALAGCSSSNGPDIGPTDPVSGNGNPGGSTPPPQPAATEALFQPLQGVLPFPTDLYFVGSTDGTLNIQPANSLSPNQAGLNSLDGFSTTAVIRPRFAGPIDAGTLTATGGNLIVITDPTVVEP